MRSKSRTIERLILGAFLVALAGGAFRSLRGTVLWTIVGVLGVVLVVALAYERRKHNASR